MSPKSVPLHSPLSPAVRPSVLPVIRQMMLTVMLAGVLGISAAGTAGAQAPALEPIPSPNLTGATPEVRQSIQTAQKRVAGLKSQGDLEQSSAFGELGMLYLYFGFVDAAEPAFKNAVRLEERYLRAGGAPTQSPWTYYLAVSQQEQGNLKAAVHSLRAVLAQREGNLPAVLRLAGLLTELGEVEEARFLYQAALQSPLGKAAGHAGLGQLALDERNPEAAVQHFEAALEAQPEATALRYRLGMALRDAGQMERGRELLKQPGGQEVQFPDPPMIQLRLQMEGTGHQAVAGGIAARQGDLAKAIDSYRDALAAQPDDLQSRRSLATALAESGDFDGAEKEFRELLRRDPNNASAYLELGSVAISKTGNPEAGLPHLQKAVELAPEFREARVRLARILAAGGRLEESIPHLQKAAELDPRDSDGRLRLARALMEVRRTADATKEVAALLAQEPDNLDAILLGGRIHAINGNPEAAEREFSRITELSSATRDQQARAFLNMALLRQAQGRVGESIDFYGKTLKLAPDQRQALFNLAVILASNQRLKGAAELYRRLLELDPSQDDVRYRLAVTQMSRGELQDASEHFETLLRKRPRAIELITSSSLLLAELGRGSEAADRLLEAISKTRDKAPKARLKSTLGAVEIKNGHLERGLGHLRDAVDLAPEVPEVRKRYAEGLAGEKRYVQAVDEYVAYGLLAPDDTQATFAHATCLILLDRWQEAVDLLTEATRSSSDLALTHLLARLLASAPDAGVRNGERAAQVAQAVFEAARNPAHGETLAMAMAAAGRWQEALALQQRLLKEAEDANFDADFVNRVRRNLTRYEQQQIGLSDW